MLQTVLKFPSVLPKKFDKNAESRRLNLQDTVALENPGWGTGSHLRRNKLSQIHEKRKYVPNLHVSCMNFLFNAVVHTSVQTASLLITRGQLVVSLLGHVVLSYYN